MSILIPKTKSALPDELAKLRTFLGKNLPEGYLDFVKEHDGARPAPNFFKVGANNGAGVEEFICVNECIRLNNIVDGFPNNVLPVARASGGNFVYLEPTNGHIHFWDHEIENDDVKIADSFEEFLAILTPVDSSHVKLKPGQVKRIWGDPNFKPEF
jgi:hypothetical protein